MSTMAEILMRHGSAVVNGDIICYCGKQYRHFTDHAEHVAEELARAGYGKLADAWDAGHDIGKHYPWGKRGMLTDDNPYRGMP